MRAHIKALGSLHIILAIIYLTFGGMGLFLFGGWYAITQTEPNPAYTVSMFGPVGGWVSLIHALYSIPELIAAIGVLLLRPWGRYSMIVVSILGLPLFPMGTVLSLYGLGILNFAETKELYAAPSQS